MTEQTRPAPARLQMTLAAAEVAAKHLHAGLGHPSTVDRCRYEICQLLRTAQGATR